MDPLVQIFAETLDVPVGDLSDESSPDTVGSWDSLAAMALVVAIEEEFGVNLSTREIMKMSSIGLARDVLKSKGVEL